MKRYIYSKSAIRATRYRYSGGFKDIRGYPQMTGVEFETTADSLQKAKSQILYQAKQRLYGGPFYKLFLIDPDGIEELPDTNPNQPVIDVPVCKKCGTRLTDGGFCPKCYMEDDEATYESEAH